MRLGGGLFQEWRTGKNTQHAIQALFRQSVLSRLAGHEDTNHAERLSVDLAMRQIIGGRAKQHYAASTGELHRHEPRRRSRVVWFHNGRGTAEQWIKEGAEGLRNRRCEIES